MYKRCLTRSCLEERFLVLVVVIEEFVKESLVLIEVLTELKSSLLFVRVEEIVEILLSVGEVLLRATLVVFVEVLSILVEIIEEIEEVLLVGVEVVEVVHEVMAVAAEEVIKIVVEVLALESVFVIHSVILLVVTGEIVVEKFVAVVREVHATTTVVVHIVVVPESVV